MRGAALAVVVALIAGALPARAHQGEYLVWIPKTHPEPALRLTQLVVRWRLGALVGEPVVLCSTAWIVDPNHLRVSEGAHSAPMEVLREVSLYDVDTGAFVSTTNGPFRLNAIDGRVTLECDAGAMGRPFLGHLNDFQKLPEEEKRRYFSFNVPGSPNWSELFKIHDGPQRGQFLDDKRAKELFKQERLRLLTHGGQGHYNPFVVEAGYSNLALVLWRQEQARKRLEKERAEREAQREERRRLRYAIRQAQRQGQAESGGTRRGGGDFWSQPSSKEKVDKIDFWSAPDDPLTVDERKQDLAWEEKHQSATQSVENARQQAANRAAALQAKRAALEKQLKGERCDRIAAGIERCRLQRCGQSPPSYTPPFFVSCRQGDPCCGKCGGRHEPPQCREQCRQGREAEARKEREANAKIARWQQCWRDAEPPCRPYGFTTVEVCKAELRRFFDSLHASGRP